MGSSEIQKKTPQTQVMQMTRTYCNHAATDGSGIWNTLGN